MSNIVVAIASNDSDNWGSWILWYQNLSCNDNSDNSYDNDNLLINLAMTTVVIEQGHSNHKTMTMRI